MPVSKRLRYEILRRDNHACRYCGATAPDAPLTVDHVVPTALGGSDDPGNLVAACGDCTSGKGASSPDAPIIDDVAADALRWAKAIRRAAELRVLERDQELALLNRFFDRWTSFTGVDGQPLKLYSGGGGSNRILRTLTSLIAAGLDEADLMRAVKIAAKARHVADEDRFRYYAGVCWREVDKRREIAAALIAAEDA